MRSPAPSRSASWSILPTRCCGPSGSDRAHKACKVLERFSAMTMIGWLQIILFCAIIVALTNPNGWYMTRVFNGERTLLWPLLRPVEVGIYRFSGVDEKREQHWVTHSVAMLLFHV